MQIGNKCVVKSASSFILIIFKSLIKEKIIMRNRFKNLKFKSKKMKVNKNIWSQKCNNKLTELWEILLLEWIADKLLEDIINGLMLWTKKIRKEDSLKKQYYIGIEGL